MRAAGGRAQQAGNASDAVASSSGRTTAQFRVNACTSKACKRQGAQQILKFLEDLALPRVEVTGTGCLGACGKGPNIVIERGPQASYEEPRFAMLSHIATPRDAIQALQTTCGAIIPENDLAAMQARLQGNELAMDGRLEEAVSKYTQGIELQPCVGAHLLLCNRSAALLQLGRSNEALADAVKALELSPPTFAKAWIRAVDSYYACGKYQEAGDVARTAIKSCPEFSALPQFKDIHIALKKVGQDIMAA